MKAAIMGYGTIGSGVYEVLDRNCKIVEKKAGEPIEVKYNPNPPLRVPGNSDPKTCDPRRENDCG